MGSRRGDRARRLCSIASPSTNTYTVFSAGRFGWRGGDGVTLLVHERVLRALLGVTFVTRGLSIPQSRQTNRQKTWPQTYMALVCLPSSRVKPFQRGFPPFARSDRGFRAIPVPISKTSPLLIVATAVAVDLPISSFPLQRRQFRRGGYGRKQSQENGEVEY